MPTYFTVDKLVDWAIEKFLSFLFIGICFNLAIILVNSIPFNFQDIITKDSKLSCINNTVKWIYNKDNRKSHPPLWLIPIMLCQRRHTTEMRSYLYKNWNVCPKGIYGWCKEENVSALDCTGLGSEQKRDRLVSHVSSEKLSLIQNEASILIPFKMQFKTSSRISRTTIIICIGSLWRGFKWIQNYKHGCSQKFSYQISSSLTSISTR